MIPMISRTLRKTPLGKIKVKCYNGVRSRGKFCKLTSLRLFAWVRREEQELIFCSNVWQEPSTFHSFLYHSSPMRSNISCLRAALEAEQTDDYFIVRRSGRDANECNPAQQQKTRRRSVSSLKARGPFTSQFTSILQPFSGYFPIFTLKSGEIPGCHFLIWKEPKKRNWQYNT